MVILTLYTCSQLTVVVVAFLFGFHSLSMATRIYMYDYQLGVLIQNTVQVYMRGRVERDIHTDRSTVISEKSED